MSAKKRPCMLIILDGWGVAAPSPSNAITRAKTPNFKKFVSTYPAIVLEASGIDIGLYFDQVGSSSIGHLNLGLGSVS